MRTWALLAVIAVSGGSAIGCGSSGDGKPAAAPCGGVEGGATTGARTGVSGAKAGVETGVAGVKQLGSATAGLAAGGSSEAKSRWKEGGAETKRTAREGGAETKHEAHRCK